VADTISAADRSRIMSRIRGQDTKPEMLVRRRLYAAGLRFRLHRRDLPGAPDIVFPSRRVALFVHGCFWHCCPKCRDGQKQVKSNTAYWGPKRARTRARDQRHLSELQSMGWSVLVIWECETRSSEFLEQLATRITTLHARAP
jgi:DNA mismatch endonuclease (patch repair protein)